ncbi:valine--tRNA ligase [bacterium]|nr:valine--tRNA ligase [bacterium]
MDLKEYTYQPEQLETKWYQYWMSQNYFKADDSSPKPPYCIVIPPPNVTGVLHMGHALTISIQDILVRHKRMSGYNVLWLPGTDHAGIATQMMVERNLKATENLSRYDLGREKFIEKVWEWKKKHGDAITNQLKKLGASLDWDRERFTMDEGLSKAVKEVFVRLYEEGLIYKSKRLINWCPISYTALSDLEVEYKDLEGSLWYIKYPIENSNEFLTIATTRPETMLGDVAVAVHPEDERFKHLIGQYLELPLVNRKIPIIGDEMVDINFGTGAVKITPAHDFNDFEAGKRHSLEMISIIDFHGKINENAPEKYRGLDVPTARKMVVDDLESLGFLVKVEKHANRVGHSQRTGTIVEPLLSEQWFVKTTPLAKPAIEVVENGTTKFYPKHWEKTYFNWMYNIEDWCISRQLWWGHQIPAYYCQECSHTHVSRDDVLVCEKCGSKNIKQDEDVLDTWFSSALWPFSTLGWPENTETLKTFYPTSVMETGSDIIFFWVARMMMMGIKFMGDVPFKDIYLHAMIRDKDGQKMSKTKNNVIDPLDVIKEFGTDALRFTLLMFTQQGRDIKLDIKRVDGYKNFINKIWNASKFAIMNLENFTPQHSQELHTLKLSMADKWILHRVNEVSQLVDTQIKEYNFSDATNTLYQFIWHEFCDWYLELVKTTFYSSTKSEDEKNASKETLYYSLIQILKLAHPFIPFVTEELYQILPNSSLKDHESIMCSSYPTYNPNYSFEGASEEMGIIMEYITQIRNIRGENNISMGKPITLIFRTNNISLIEKSSDYLMSQCRAEKIEFTNESELEFTASALCKDSLIFIPLKGLIDVDSELSRLNKQMLKLEKDIEFVSKKLNNPSFVDSAPVTIVEKEREKLTDYLKQEEIIKNDMEKMKKLL